MNCCCHKPDHREEEKKAPGPVRRTLGCSGSLQVLQLWAKSQLCLGKHISYVQVEKPSSPQVTCPEKLPITSEISKAGIKEQCQNTAGPLVLTAVFNKLRKSPCSDKWLSSCPLQCDTCRDIPGLFPLPGMGGPCSMTGISGISIWGK